MAQPAPPPPAAAAARSPGHRALSRFLEALVTALFVALLAPVLAAAAYAVTLAALPAQGSGTFDTGIQGLVLLGLGLAGSAYFLGTLPAFAAGLTLPWLRRRLAPLPASAGTGLLGALAYLASTGAHLLSPPAALPSTLTPVAAAFVGTAAAAWVYMRRAPPGAG